MALALVVIGLGTALAGYRRWRANEDAIRGDRPLPAGWLAPSWRPRSPPSWSSSPSSSGSRCCPGEHPAPGTRTNLAWQRTGLGPIAIAALIGARAFNTGATSLLLIAGAAGLFGAGVLGVLTPLRLQPAPAAARGRGRRRGAGSDRFITAAVVLIGVLAGVAVLAVPSR